MYCYIRQRNIREEGEVKMEAGEEEEGEEHHECISQTGTLTCNIKA